MTRSMWLWFYVNGLSTWSKVRLVQRLSTAQSTVQLDQRLVWSTAWSMRDSNFQWCMGVRCLFGLDFIWRTRLEEKNHVMCSRSNFEHFGSGQYAISAPFFANIIPVTPTSLWYQLLCSKKLNHHLLGKNSRYPPLFRSTIYTRQ